LRRELEELYTRLALSTDFTYEGFDRYGADGETSDGNFLYGPGGEPIDSSFFTNGVETENTSSEDVLRRLREMLEEEAEANSAGDSASDSEGQPLANR
jgi:hypothetical protein